MAITNMANIEPFESIRVNQFQEDAQSVEMIDYSILLTRVFGHPVDASTAFMYLFRRYGYPVLGWDDCKDLCNYAFMTEDEEIVVRWRIHPGEYHHHLCAFASNKLRWECVKEDRKPCTDWHNRIAEWAKENYGWLYYSLFDVFVPSKEVNGRMDFIGSEEQKKEILDFINKHYEGKFESEAWVGLDKWKDEGNERYREMYKKEIESCPKKPDFRCKFDEQLAASEVQHQWILSMPVDSQIRRVYFAVMALFEDWKRPTYVRDQYFNLVGKESKTNRFPECVCPDDGDEMSVDSCGYYEYAGYGLSEEAIEVMVNDDFGQWVSTKEKYPIDSDEKLVRLKDGTIRVAHYDNDDEGFFWYDCASSEGFVPEDVTHWMPIPDFNKRS